MEISEVTLEDAGKYRVTAKNDGGECHASISLNFDSEYKSSSNVACCCFVERRDVLEVMRMEPVMERTLVTSQFTITGSLTFTRCFLLPKVN